MTRRSQLTYLCFIFLLISCQRSGNDIMDKANHLYNNQEYSEAIKAYSKVISRNAKLELSYYNRGYCYYMNKDYAKAYEDFNEIIKRKTKNGFVISINRDLSEFSEEAKYQVDYYDALYYRTISNYYLDSLNKAYADFQLLIDKDYSMKSNCFLFQGGILVQSGMLKECCDKFKKAEETALTKEDKTQALEMLTTYCSTSMKGL